MEFDTGRSSVDWRVSGHQPFLRIGKYERRDKAVERHGFEANGIVKLVEFQLQLIVRCTPIPAFPVKGEGEVKSSVSVHSRDGIITTSPRRSWR